MTPHPLHYRPAQNQAASAQITQVQRDADGTVIVRVAYPQSKFRDGMIRAGLVPLGLVAFSMMFFWYEGSLRARDAVFFLPLLILACVLIPLLMLHNWRRSGTYTFEARADGITLHRNRGRCEWTERIPREQIADVIIGFGPAGRHGARSTAWLIIALQQRRNRKLLHDLAGDELARVADALRAGIGLPRRSWP